MSALVLLVVALLLLAVRVNLILVLIFIAGAVHLYWGPGRLEFFVQDIWSAMDREIILAVPLFILVGSVMRRGSIADLFMAGVGPGILLTLVFSVYAIAVNWRLASGQFSPSALGTAFVQGILVHVHSVLPVELGFVQTSASQRWIE